MTKPVIALCMPIYNKVDPRNMASYRTLDRSDLGWQHLTTVDWPVQVARNMITAEALANKDVTHLLWIDDDMVYPSDSLKRLLAHDKDFVGGLCFDRRPPYKPVIARYFDKSWGYDPDTLGWFFDYPKDKLIEVDATGGAFLLIRREVFERVSELYGHGDPTWQGWWTPLDTATSEDLSFCRRAQASGTRLFVDTGTKIGHVGEVVVDEAFALRNRASAYHQWHPPLDALADALGTQPRGAIANAIEQGIDGGLPVATVVIPTFNQRPDFLLAAVKSALAQTVPVEVIVVDDGSSPSVNRADLPAHPNLTLYWHPENKGIAAALNTGIRHMTTEWFGWLSSDDLYEPEKIERHLTALLNVGALAGYTGYNLKTDNHNGGVHVQTLIWNDLATQRAILARNCAINGSTVLIHKSVLNAVGPFDTDLRYGQDWDFWRRVGQDYLWHGMPDKLTTRREFGNLTEKLTRSKDLRKQAEDEIVMSRYGTIERITRWYDQIPCIHANTDVGTVNVDGPVCRDCMIAALTRLLVSEGK